MRPSFARNFLAPRIEGAGKTGCALHPRSHVRLAQSKLHMSIQGSGEHPAFPAQWLYGLCRALLGDEFWIDSVTAVSALASQLKRILQLDACNGRQDHTVLPYAKIHAVVRREPASIATRPTSVTTADALLTRTGWTDTTPDLPFWKSEIFFISGLDMSSDNRK